MTSADLAWAPISWMLQFQGVSFLILFFVWMLSLWNPETTESKLGSSDRIWILVCGLFGFIYAASSIFDWGLPYAGTAVAIGLCMSFAFYHPVGSACFVTAILFLRPWELVGANSQLSLLPRLGFVVAIGHMLHSLRRDFVSSVSDTKMNRLILSFTVWCLFTTFFAPDPSASVSLFFDGFIKSVFLYLLITRIIYEQHGLELFRTTLFISFLSIGVISLVQSFEASGTDFGTRLVGFGAFKNSNDIAALMVMIMPFSCALLFAKDKQGGNEHFVTRSLGGSLLAVSLLCVVLSRSRGAMLGVGAMGALFIFLKMKKRSWPLWIGVCLVSIGLAAVSLNDRRGDDLSLSSAGRLTYLKAGFRMGMSNPVLGVGFGGYPESLERFSTESLEESRKMTAHNSFVLVFAETGAVGFAIFVLLFTLALKQSIKLNNDKIAPAPEYLFALIGYGTSIFFLSHSYLMYPFLLFGLIHIENRIKNQVENKKETAYVHNPGDRVSEFAKFGNFFQAHL